MATHREISDTATGGISSMFPVVTVADAAAWRTEPLGSKRKFWFQHESSIPYLFKEARSGTGEDWSEKVACELCRLLGLPHVHYDLAIWKHNRGVVCPTCVPDDGQLVHGNELLAYLLPEYPRQQSRGVSQHMLEPVFAILQNREIHMPFVPFGMMRDLHAVYESAILFPLFANRLLSKTRPEYRDFLAWLDVPEHAAEPLVLLALTEGMRATDTLMVFPHPEKSSDGKYHVRFFSHGLRYVLPAVVQFIDEHLHPLTQLFLMLDPQNPHDPSAVALRTADPALLVGYCPRFLTADVRPLLQTVPATVHVAVERVNRDAPLQLRLLCNLIADWPDNFQPCSDALYEALA